MSIKKGNVAEQQAVLFLQQQGLKLVQQNFRCRSGEIDIIAFDRDTLVFVEVKLRQNQNYASAGESITYSKQQRILRTAQYFLYTHPQYQNCDLRFDGVLFSQINHPPDWVQSAFDA
jgi:putative endonuclease